MDELCGGGARRGRVELPLRLTTRWLDARQDLHPTESLGRGTHALEQLDGELGRGRREAVRMDQDREGRSVLPPGSGVVGTRRSAR